MALEKTSDAVLQRDTSHDDDDLPVETNVIDLSPVAADLPLKNEDPDPPAQSDPPPPPDVQPAANETPRPTSPLALPPPPLTMPTLSNLSELTLHSPSSQIVGTPFATNSSRFEYPFPETSSSTNSESSTSSNAYVLSSYPSISSMQSSSFQSLSSSSSMTSSPPNVAVLPASFPPPLELTNYTATHPKLMRPQNPPPVPPSLTKKRHRWSLGLMGRRRSSYGSQTSDGSSAGSSSVPSIDAVVEQDHAEAADGGHGTDKPPNGS